jgi:16S rRNA processing protein RimM
VEAGEHYREDLLGFRVYNAEGVDFGVLEAFLDLPANAVMVVKGDKERWLPVTPQHLSSIDREARCIRVDWPAIFDVTLRVALVTSFPSWYGARASTACWVGR